MFDLVQSCLDSDITHETYDELLEGMTEVNAVKLRIGEKECLSLPIEEPKDLDMTTNGPINDEANFQLQIDSFLSNLKEQLSAFKQSFMAELSQFTDNFLQTQAADTDSNLTEKLFYDELKSKNTVISLLLDSLIKYYVEKRNIQIMTLGIFHQKNI